MNLSITQIYSKKFAVIVFVVVGLFVLAGGCTLLKAAKNSAKPGIGPSLSAAQEDNNKKTDISLDSDGDGLPDSLEKILETNPKSSDTDSDGYKDGEEVKNGYSPLVSGPRGKYESEQFKKIKRDIQNFSPEVYKSIFGKKEKNTASIPFNSISAISLDSSPAVSSALTPVPVVFPSLAVLKEKSINKNWSYVLYVPPNFDAAKDYPLVLIFYGTSGMTSDSIDNWRNEADKNGFIVAALKPYEKKYPSGNVVESYPWDEASGFASSALKDIKKEHKINEKNIFLEGYSTGAATAYIVALESGIKFKGIIAIGGYLPLEAGIIEKLINANGLNFYVIHRANDADLKAIIAQEKTLAQYGAKMNFVTLPDVAAGEYPAAERENIAEWMNGLM